jgi:transcriptional regulator with XRE-family HTH domain
MNEPKIGNLIQQLRKEKNLTQKELANQLNVTDKAVSKWERGLSYPDLALIIPLSKLLDISAGELLAGEKKSISPPKEPEKIIEEAFVYSDKNSKNKLNKLKVFFFMLLSVSIFLASCICFICDIVITGRFTWSLIVFVSLLFSWLLLLPLFIAKNKPVRAAFLTLSVILIPYLVVLGRLLDVKLVYTLGWPISVLALMGLWMIYWVFCKFKHRMLVAVGITALIGIPLCWGINLTVAFILEQSTTNSPDYIINIISLGILAVTCLGLDYMKSHR